MPDILTGKALNDVHKAVFICNEYQDKTIREVASLLEMSALDINNALWRAEDLGNITVVEQRTFTINKLPAKWEFGEDVELLHDQIKYTFNHMARSEADIEETYLSNMTRGYPAQDVLIAIKQLIAEGVITAYTLTNQTAMPQSKKAKGRGDKAKTVEDTYTFYTLVENVSKGWGKKQFTDQDRVQ